MQSSEIRAKFLKFFEGKGHKVLPGASLVPADPTVLLTLAGMLQFKPIFLGQERPQFKRAATVQKCVRTNDIDQVGLTPRHHTFFEMLGNFSFGDYFKPEAIQFAWELLTKEFAIPVTKLKIAVYEKDDEAYDIWQKQIGLPKEIIFRLGEDNNFWAVGPTGPCGPCSEIYYDLGEGHGCGKADCAPGCDCERFLEIWNLVFIQYNRNEQGELVPLQQKGIDTGLGLERITAVLQGVGDNFETDLFTPLLKKLEAYAKNNDPVARKIVVDHARAVTNLIADGVLPGNTGRGYILRRLIRRAVRYGRKLGIDRPFLVEMARVVIAGMGEVYPNLPAKAPLIADVLAEEETNFLGTLALGLKLFEEMAGRHGDDKLLSGAEAFKLHDTYGFPVELTTELCAEKGLRVDQAGFAQEMSAQKDRARQSGLEGDRKKVLLSLDLAYLKPTNFTGYEKTVEESKVLAIFPDHNLVVLEKTPFYGESGGQVGDTGILSYNKTELMVHNTLVTPQGTVLHEVDRLEDLKVGQSVKATIDAAKRRATQAHHTATHLLHKALRETLGEHVQQAGSYVGPDKLRFDFSHFHALSLNELQQVEMSVNKKINEKIKVEILKKSFQDAVKLGATALFGEKYGDQVRVQKIGTYSLELCGGTHVANTGDIHYFKIVSEGALGSGVRRIEALAGQEAKVYVVYTAKRLRDKIEAMIKRYRQLQQGKERAGGSKTLETNIFEIELTELERLGLCVDNQDSVTVNKFLDHLQGRVDWLEERIAKAERELASLKAKSASGGVAAYLAEVKEINGHKVLLKEFPDYSLEMLRAASDALQGKLGSCLLVLVASYPGRLTYLITVTQDLVNQGFSARKLAEVFTGVVGGKGGGRDNKFEGGGKDPGKIAEAFLALAKTL